MEILRKRANKRAASRQSAKVLVTVFFAAFIALQTACSYIMESPPSPTGSPSLPTGSAGNSTGASSLPINPSIPMPEHSDDAGGSVTAKPVHPLPSESTQPEQQLVRYTGPVEHIFFHPLIVYPQLAFDGDAMAKGYDDWFVTVSEFQKILDALYRKGYVLISLDSLYDFRQVDGKTMLTEKELRLPAAKKPLILSVDDVNYYDYMRDNGNIQKLVLDDFGNVAGYTVDPIKQQPSVCRDCDIVPILDDFVRKHPDFSLNGAKGILALTGYEGILGYRTQDPSSANYERERMDALRVVSRLKETGWTFSSHSWGHRDAAKISAEHFIWDTDRWKREVEPLIGPTPVYIYPYGSSVPSGSAKYNALLERGFRVLCSVGPNPYKKFTGQALQMDRRHIDGMSLRTDRRRLSVLFDAAEVIDPSRP